MYFWSVGMTVWIQNEPILQLNATLEMFCSWANYVLPYVSFLKCFILERPLWLFGNGEMPQYSHNNQSEMAFWNAFFSVLHILFMSICGKTCYFNASKRILKLVICKHKSQCLVNLLSNSCHNSCDPFHDCCITDNFAIPYYHHNSDWVQFLNPWMTVFTACLEVMSYIWVLWNA